MARKSMPVYMTEEQKNDLIKLHDTKYPHMSLSSMIIEIAMREARRENK